MAEEILANPSLSTEKVSSIAKEKTVVQEQNHDYFSLQTYILGSFLKEEVLKDICLLTLFEILEGVIFWTVFVVCLFLGYFFYNFMQNSIQGLPAGALVIFFSIALTITSFIYLMIKISARQKRVKNRVKEEIFKNLKADSFNYLNRIDPKGIGNFDEDLCTWYIDSLGTISTFMNENFISSFVDLIPFVLYLGVLFLVDFEKQYLETAKFLHIKISKKNEVKGFLSSFLSSLFHLLYDNDLRWDAISSSFSKVNDASRKISQTFNALKIFSYVLFFTVSLSLKTNFEGKNPSKQFYSGILGSLTTIQTCGLKKEVQHNFRQTCEKEYEKKFRSELILCGILCFVFLLISAFSFYQIFLEKDKVIESMQEVFVRFSSKKERSLLAYKSLFLTLAKIGICYANCYWIYTFFRQSSGSIITLARSVIEMIEIAERITILKTIPLTNTAKGDKIERPISHIFLQNADLGYDLAKGKPPILRNVNLNISPGTMLILEGSSGSGKSLLCKVLTQTVEVKNSSSAIFSDGMKYYLASDFDRSYIMKYFGWCPQTLIFPKNKTLREFFHAIAPAATENEMKEALRKVSLLEWLEEQPHGLNTSLGNNGNTISGGQKARVYFAAYLLKRQSVDSFFIILDETFESLDEKTKLDIMAAVEREVVLYGMVAIIVTHVVSVLLKALSEEFQKNRLTILHVSDGTVEAKSVEEYNASQALIEGVV